MLKISQDAQKGPAARRRPKAAREAYFLYVERAAEGANEADGPFSSEKTRARAMRRVQLRGGARRPPARRTTCTSSGRPRAPTKQMGPSHRKKPGLER